jgi:hypothetical protein
VQEKQEQLALRVPQAKLDRLVELEQLVPPEKLVSLVHQEILDRLGRLVKLDTLVQVVLLVKPEQQDSQE